jgi:acylphosphatase
VFLEIGYCRKYVNDMDKENHQNPDEITRVHIWVTGRVQGVGFRAFVLSAGSALGLTGWVHNVGYNQVETLAEGTRLLISRFVDSVRTGPRVSRVDDVRIEWENPTGEFRYFEVR